MYALIGGAAIVGAALAFHYASQKATSEDDEQGIDNDLEELGPIQKDDQGFIKFE